MAWRLRKKKSKPRLVYAANARCSCGFGLAYRPGKDRSWDCSGILLGTAAPEVTHTDRLPFSFYEVRSEKQPSANGRTTRPA
jgi:hypothetical protein